jgi:hypothetical protein
VLIPAAGLTYVLYVGAFLSPSSAFTIVAGAILGVGAGCLWTAQGAIMVRSTFRNTLCTSLYQSTNMLDRRSRIPMNQKREELSLSFGLYSICK